ncbi:MAG TPA: Hint domain-containing protein [Chloroflexia bacterium]|jgi:hypothetical protein
MRRLLCNTALVAAVVLTTIFQPLAHLELLAAPTQHGNCRTFTETGKTVCGRFLEYWQANGGLAQQGYPISGEFSEVSELDGRKYLVQYFERAVFEHHPENPQPYDVLLSQLGRVQFDRKYPAPSLILSTTELKYRIFEMFGRYVRYCDPDYYPIGSAEVERRSMLGWYAAVDRTTDEFKTILRNNNLSSTDDLTPDHILAIYRDYKRLHSFLFEKEGERYKFRLTTSKEGDPGPSGPGNRVEGFIQENGLVEVTSSTPTSFRCPLICLSGSTMISSLDGAVPVRDLRVGMSIWTVDEKGVRRSATILKTSRVAVGADHQMVRLKLEDGRELSASPGHPIADGRTLGSLREGDTVDGVRVLSADLVPYGEGYTYDVLPSGGTGHYWANGILLGSTLTSK